MVNLVLIGASTGGPKVLPELFALLPPLDACILVVQHMPQYINASFISTLGKYAAMPVVLARERSALEAHRILVAPSGTHCTIDSAHRIRLTIDPEVNYVRPAVDVTMQSVRRATERQIIAGVVLTGMGVDGAAGLRHLKGLGGITFAQDQASSAVFGMPAAAIKMGVADYVLNPPQIAHELARLLAARAPLNGFSRP